MQKTYLSILFSVFALISSNHSFGQCVIIDSEGCEKTIYKINANKKTTEIIVDSCGNAKASTSAILKFSYNAQNQCSGIRTEDLSSKLMYDVNKRLIKSNLTVKIMSLSNTFQYTGKNLTKIITKADLMMGMKMETITKYTYIGDNISKITISENLTDRTYTAIDSVVYLPAFPKSPFDDNIQGVRDLTLGFYTGMGSTESLLDGSLKPIKSFYLTDQDTCDSPIKVEYEYEFTDKPYPTSIIKKKTCNGKTTTEKHLNTVECK
jgi:hypothetical protein